MFQNPHLKSLQDIAAKLVGKTLPFELVQSYKIPFPEELQLKIAFYAFPDDESNIRLYSTLANNSAEEFKQGELILISFQNFKNYNHNLNLNHHKKNSHYTNPKPIIKNIINIGFHLSGEIDNHKVSVMFDRNKINSCSCQCKKYKPVQQSSHSMMSPNSLTIPGSNSVSSAVNSRTTNRATELDFFSDVSISSSSQNHLYNSQNKSVWCKHVVALCLFRIRYPNLVQQRVPFSNSLSQLKYIDLQKFAQYLIDEMPLEILPMAQKILDKLTSAEDNEIKRLHGAPDPTAGAMISDAKPEWYLDKDNLRQQIQKELNNFMFKTNHHHVYLPDDRNLLIDNSNTYESKINFNALIKTLTSKESNSNTAIWHLCNIVKDLFSRQDNNAYELLLVLTTLMVEQDKLIFWWVKVVFSPAYLDVKAWNDAADINTIIHVLKLPSHLVPMPSTTAIEPTPPSFTSRSRNNNRNRNGFGNALSQLPKSSNKPKESQEEFTMRTCHLMFKTIVDWWSLAFINPEMEINLREFYVNKLKSFNQVIVGKMKANLKITSDRLINMFEGFNPALQTNDLFLKVTKPEVVGNATDTPTKSLRVDSRWMVRARGTIST